MDDMNLNHPQPAPSPLAPYPSISIFSTLLSHTTGTVPLSARVLIELCRNIARDLDYVARLREDVQLTLDMCPAHHAEWIDGARKAASQALYLVNQHIESKIPRKEATALLKGNANDMLSKVASVVNPGKKDAEGISSLRANLSTAHASLMAAAGLMQQLGLRSGDLLPMTTQLQRSRTSSAGSEEQGTSLSAAGVLMSETSTLV